MNAYKDDNDVFYSLACAYANRKKQRLKGWYICPNCGEFIKAAAKKAVPCPFCSRMTGRIMYINSVMEQTIHDRWRADGTFSERAAGMENYKEKEKYLA